MFRKILTLVVISVSALFAQSHTAQLMQEVEAHLNVAKNINSHILCQKNFLLANEHYNNAKSYLEEGISKYIVEEELSKSIDYIEKMNSDIDRKSEFFNEIISARNNAEKNKAPKFATELWQTSETNFKELLELFEENYLLEAETYIPSVVDQYMLAEARAEKADYYLTDWLPYQTANSNMAVLLSPTVFNKGMQHFQNGLTSISKKDLQTYEEELELAEDYFDIASVNAINFAEINPDLLNERNEAQLAGADMFAKELWVEAENSLASAAEEYENKNYDNTDQKVSEAKEKYIKAKHFSNKERFLSNARAKINIAETAGAFEYAPITLEKSKKILSDASNLIEYDYSNFVKIKSVAKSACNEAEKALAITELVKSIETGSSSLEKVILDWNILGFDSVEKEPYMPVATTPQYTSEGKYEEPESHSTPIYSNLDDDFVITDTKDEYVIEVVGVEFSSVGNYLDQNDKIILRKAAALLAEYPGAPITVMAYTDNVGPKSYNKLLSEQRANSVAEYLEEVSTLNSLLISAVGAGEDNPAYDNKTFEGRKKNNRIELVVSKNNL